MKLLVILQVAGRGLRFEVDRHPTAARARVAAELGTDVQIRHVAVPPSHLGAPRLTSWLEGRFALSYSGQDCYSVDLGRVRLVMFWQFVVLPLVRQLWSRARYMIRRSWYLVVPAKI